MEAIPRATKIATASTKNVVLYFLTDKFSFPQYSVIIYCCQISSYFVQMH